MGSIWLTDLADVLRKAGLSVKEYGAWQAQAYPKWGGFDAPPTHVMCHHTASNPGSDPDGDLRYITEIHTLRPICQLYLSRSGTFYVTAAGKVCTNGAGSSQAWNGGVPDNMMNHYAISIEAANNGLGEPWPTEQVKAYVHGVAALCKAYGIPVNHVRAHHEWAPGRKIDPAGPSPYAVGAAKWDMNRFRADVNADLNTEEDEMKMLPVPYRTDTRTANRPLAAGEVRDIAVMMGGSGVMVNLTVVPIGGVGGYLTAWDPDVAKMPATSMVNWSGKDGPVANTALIPTRSGNIRVRATVACHLVTDTQGYLP